MDSPFVFGKIARGKTFINRREEVKHLSQNFNSGINTMLISPRRWGKSSLVLAAAAVSAKENRNIRFCHIDLFRINSIEEFYGSLTTEILKASSGKWQEWVSSVKEFLSGISPSISLGPDPSQEFSLKIDFEKNEKDEGELLNLSEKIAKKKKIKFVVCIDEFQKISEFDDGNTFQEKLRSYWQKQDNTSYCLYGSKRHIISELFTSRSQPFYQFGDLIFLQKIEEKYWHSFIRKQFKSGGKSISREIINQIISISANHPYHMQQFAHHLWRNTDKIADEKTIKTTIDELLINNEILFKREIENLTPLQLGLLKAIVNKEIHLNSMETVKNYGLGSPGSIGTLKKGLETKEIIDFYDSEYQFINPFFEYWLKNEYFLS
jgi:hypothetical protein